MDPTEEKEEINILDQVWQNIRLSLQQTRENEIVTYLSFLSKIGYGQKLA